MHRLLPLLILALLSACASRQTAWDGRRGYDGRGDYGYDLDASRTTSRGSGPAARYAPPGPPEDPWGPYIREAASRQGVPELWIREVMRQESAGRVDATSRTGAMGLMQIMPATWNRVAPRLGHRGDPYEPRANIHVGAAFLREMHERFGAPGFLAAYNAGPDRVALFLAGSTVLPDETMDYVARIAPRIGVRPERAGAFAEAFSWRDGGAYGARAYAADDPSLRAYDGGGLVTADAPTGRLGR